MYEWLERELDGIGTRRFQVTFAEEPATWVSQSIDWPSRPPPSLSEFIRRFGAVQLYRESSFYLVRVWTRPVAKTTQEVMKTRKKGDVYLIFGGYWTGVAGYKPDELASMVEPPVWETVGAAGFRKTAASFEDWIELRAATARKWYSKRAWRAILRGPAPFSEEEHAIVQARRSFRWRLLEVASDGSLRFEVANESDRVLPYLSIGLRAPGFVGGVSLPVSDIRPGETAIVEHKGYGKLTDPHHTEAFSYPDPEPEDRDRYRELGEPGP